MLSIFLNACTNTVVATPELLGESASEPDPPKNVRGRAAFAAFATFVRLSPLLTTPSHERRRLDRSLPKERRHFPDRLPALPPSDGRGSESRSARPHNKQEKATQTVLEQAEVLSAA